MTKLSSFYQGQRVVMFAPEYWNLKRGEVHNILAPKIVRRDSKLVIEPGKLVIQFDDGNQQVVEINDKCLFRR